MKARWRTKKIRFICGILAVAFLCLAIGYIANDWSVFDDDGNATNTGRQEILLDAKIVDSDSPSFYEGSKVRNSIYDRNFKEVAVSFTVASVYVKPLEITGGAASLKRISDLLDLDEEELVDAVASERGFVWLKRNLDSKLARKISDLKIPGVYVNTETKRYYPYGKNASHVLGFVENEIGLAGVEAFYDHILNGDFDTGEGSGSQDKGAIVLSIDLEVQKYVESKLAKLVSDNQARSGMAVLIAPGSGEIIALANYPSYDSNLFWKYDSFERRNRVVSESIRPGGLFEFFKMAAEVEGGNIPTFLTEPQEIAKKIISPRFVKKIVSPKLKKEEVGGPWKELHQGVYWSAVENPFNYVLSRSDLDEFFEKYGLTGSTGVDLPLSQGISTGDQEENLETTVEVSGQSSATLIQIATAFSRMLVGDNTVLPHVLKETWNEKETAGNLKSSKSKEEPEGSVVANNYLLRLLRALAGGGLGEGVFLETIIEEKDDLAGKDFEITQSDDSETVVDDSVDEVVASRYHYNILGVNSSIVPQAVIALVLDGAIISTDKSLGMQSSISKIAEKALKIQRNNHKKELKIENLPDQKLYSLWSKLNRGKATEQVAEKRKVEKMPSVTGLSLRKALQDLQNYDLRISTVGSGRVVSQHPKPGTKLKDVRDCVLELKVDK